MRNLFYCVLFLLLSMSYANAQLNVKDSMVSAPLLGLSYAHQFPGGDMVNRYASNSNVGINFMFKTKQNWFWSADLNYLFGRTIKDATILDNLKTSNGQIININGLYADVRVSERGYFTSAKVGRIFPWLSPNKNCGFVFAVGPGFLQHKIRYDDIGNTTPQLSKEYRKGYDRLTNGLAVTAFLGYLFLDNRYFINFFAGVEFIQAWTQNRRGYNFDTMQYDTAKRIDQLTGCKVGIIIPLYKKVPNEFYTY